MQNENLDPSKEHLSEADQVIEKALRPKMLEDFTGQAKIVENLQIFIQVLMKYREFLVFQLELYQNILIMIKKEENLIISL